MEPEYEIQLGFDVAWKAIDALAQSNDSMCIGAKAEESAKLAQIQGYVLIGSYWPCSSVTRDLANGKSCKHRRNVSSFK
jgi:hypothetical protein